ncbi:MAG: RecX family transcriptional regulator [Clostridia bacterium]|nr:RecX family transcriptional regulator [Clostridia bacterium]
MAVITKIEQQKNKARVNIFVDDAFFCGINKETALIFKFKVGQVTSEETLKQAVFESETKSAFEKASSYLETRMHSKKELADKLIKKGYSKESSNEAINKLEEYHFVDDALFAKQFLEQNGKLSKNMIKNKLLQKGVPFDIVNDALSLREEDDEFVVCEKQVQKYLKSKTIENYNDLSKMYASMLRKGFSIDTVKKVSKKLISKADLDDENYDD